MSDTVVLKSFLMKLGFTVDEAQFRRFQESMASISKNAISMTKAFVEVGGALAVTAKVADSTFQKIAKPLEGLYFSAQRLNSAPAQIYAYQKALEQVGISAQETQAMLQGFANARATNPGLNAAFGIDPNQKNAAIAFRQALANIEAQDDGSPFSRNYAIRRASQLGIGAEEYTTLKQNADAIQNRYLPQVIAELKKHPNFNADAINAHLAENSRRMAGTSFDLAAADVAGNEAKSMGKLYDETGKLIDQFSKLNDVTGGWAGRLTVVSGLLTTFAGSLGGLKALLGAAGKLGAGEAASGAVAAEGGGLLGAAGGLVAPLVAAIAGAHYLNKWTKGTFWDTDQGAGQGESFQQQMAGLTGSIANFVASFEGHARDGFGVYKDEGGHETVGYGHLVRPGEDFSKGLDRQGALTLLQKDLASASEAVKRLVHVALNSNQMKALTDFVFNVGERNFKNSTLLRDLNAGDYAAASARFGDYDKIFKNGHYVVSEGLARRRTAEGQLFRTPDNGKATVSLQMTNEFNITGKDANEIAGTVARNQKQSVQDIVRNVQPAVG